MKFYLAPFLDKHQPQRLDFKFSTACVPFTLVIDALPLLYPFFPPFSVLCAIVQMHLGPNIPEKKAIFLSVSNSMENAGAAMMQKIINSEFQSCLDNSYKPCIGAQNSNYVYALLEGKVL